MRTEYGAKAAIARTQDAASARLLRQRSFSMNHHVPCSGVPPDDLLDLIYHYKALLIRQLHLWFAGREAAVDQRQSGL